MTSAPRPEPTTVEAVGAVPDTDPHSRPAAVAEPVSVPARRGGAFRAAALEAGLVVFGVVLAFAANEWRENRNAVARGEHAMASLLEELSANREAVASSHEYHRGLLGAISAARESGVAPRIDTFGRGFVSPASVYHTAWDSASATGALETVDYSVLLRLSRVYAQQGRYEDQVGSIGPLIYAEMYRSGTAGILANYANLASLIGTFAYRERELMEAYDIVLAELGSP